MSAAAGCREPSGRTTPGRERSSRSRARAVCSARSFDRRAPRFERRFDMRLEFIERLADRALQFRLRGLEPRVGDLRENAGFASEPRIAQRFPAVFVRCALLRPDQTARAVRRSAPLPARASPHRAAGEFFRSELDSRPLRDGNSQWRRHLACPDARGTGDFGCAKTRREGGATKPPSPPGTAFREIRFCYALAFAPSEALACSTSCVNPAASFTAMSDRILRSISTPAAFSPCISWL